MRLVFISLTIVVCAIASVARVVDQPGDKKYEAAQRTTAVDGNATVTLCVMAGQVTVRGWNKNEVRARSADSDRIELRRVDAAGEESKPAKKIDVFIDDKSTNGPRGDCQASADVELDVPQGATVQVQTRDGDINITGVEVAYAGSQNGDITIEHVKQMIEAGSIGGSIYVKDSSGRITLTSAGGGIEATNINPVDAGDNFEVTSVSGDIQLEKVSHAKLSAKSVTGNINLAGTLAHSGNYGFNTMSGDVVLSLPGDSSFRLVAKLAQDGEIISDFPLTLTAETVPQPKAPRASAAAGAVPPAPPKSTPPAAVPQPKVPEKNPTAGNVTIVKVTPTVKVTPAIVAIPYGMRRINAVCGTGDASINVASFSGTLHLQKN